MDVVIIDLFKNTPDYLKYNKGFQTSLGYHFSVYYPQTKIHYPSLVVEDEPVCRSWERPNELGIFDAITIKFD